MARDGEVLSGTPDIWERNCAEAISLHGDKLAKVTQGTYTPTLTIVANLDNKTAYLCTYSRNGNMVTVSGRVDVDPTVTNTTTELGISLPIASTFANDFECGGTAAGWATGNVSGAIFADVANARASLKFTSVSVLNNGMWFTFGYRVI